MRTYCRKKNETGWLVPASTIFEAISLGFRQLNETIGGIDGNVQRLSVDLYQVRSYSSSLPIGVLTGKRKGEHRKVPAP